MKRSANNTWLSYVAKLVCRPRESKLMPCSSMPAGGAGQGKNWHSIQVACKWKAFKLPLINFHFHVGSSFGGGRIQYVPSHVVFEILASLGCCSPDACIAQAVLLRARGHARGGHDRCQRPWHSSLFCSNSWLLEAPVLASWGAHLWPVWQGLGWQQQCGGRFGSSGAGSAWWSASAPCPHAGRIWSAARPCYFGPPASSACAHTCEAFSHVYASRASTLQCWSTKGRGSLPDSMNRPTEKPSTVCCGTWKPWLAWSKISGTWCHKVKWLLVIDKVNAPMHWPHVVPLLPDS